MTTLEHQPASYRSSGFFRQAFWTLDTVKTEFLACRVLVFWKPARVYHFAWLLVILPTGAMMVWSSTGSLEVRWGTTPRGTQTIAKKLPPWTSRTEWHLWGPRAVWPSWPRASPKLSVSSQDPFALLKTMFTVFIARRGYELSNGPTLGNSWDWSSNTWNNPVHLCMS